MGVSIFKYSFRKKKISLTYLPLFIFEAMVILIYYNNMGFEILVSCAFIIFLSMFILGEYIREKSKFLFLYLGVGSSLLSLCCMLIVLGIGQLDFIHSIIAFFAMLLPSIFCNTYFEKRAVRKMLSGQNRRDNTKLEPFVKLACSLGVLSGIIEMRFLSVDGKNLVGIVSFGIVFYLFQRCAISEFHKEIIRRRYNININNWLKQQSAKPARKR